MEVLESSKVSDAIHIESLHSERAKQLASEISNDVARRILKELYRNPTSISDLSEKLSLPISTVQYHINRLLDLGVVRIAQKKFGKRMKEVKMYAYDKEGIVFLSSSQREEFESFLGRLITQAIKGLSMKMGVFIF
ncbi:MAG: winged helix-turn-helix transcriptional regulator [Archaeoglobus sp.]|nr:winged helix-turn-helix transcriptional regulator [Archaeoglobus sp.]